MNRFAFEPAPQVSVAIADAETRFPVRRIYCIGRNYEAHVREMGHDPSRSPPIFFCKPADALVEVTPSEEAVFPYPSATADCHHEIELVVAIGKSGRNIAKEAAASHIFGYAIGIDMTRRDLQRAAARGGQPWETGKAFDYSAPMGPLHAIESTGVIADGAIALEVNGQPRQAADLAQLIWSVDEIIAELSGLFELHPGDLIFSGTPEGVGAVVKGDLMTGRIDGLGEIHVRVS